MSFGALRCPWEREPRCGEWGMRGVMLGPVPQRDPKMPQKSQGGGVCTIQKPVQFFVFI